MRLMQMHPCTAYGTGTKTGKKRIKGKGARKEDSFDKAFDPQAKFRHPERYEDFKKARKKLFPSEGAQDATVEGEGGSRDSALQ